jgi:hypothetical protein
LSDDSVIKVCDLGGGVVATIKDCTSHYFGGYYHVRILISADVPVCDTSFDVAADFEDALVRLGGTVNFSRTLEKMAVPETEIEVVRQKLLADFDANVLPYLLRVDFAPSFVRSEYRKKLTSVPTFRRYHT